MRIVAWLLAVLVVAWAAFRLLGLDRGHPFVAMVALTPYVAVAAGVIALLLAAARQWRPALVALAGAIALAAVVLPRGLGGAAEPAGPRLRVLTANVLVGQVPAQALVDIVRERRVDVLSVQELTPELDTRLRRAGLRKLLPHAVVAPAAGAAGTGIYSRLRLRRLPPPRGSVLGQVAARAQWEPLGRIDVVAVHPPPPTSAPQVARWRRTLRGLAGRDRPGLLLGDFNATLDHRELRRLLDDGYVDAADATGDGLEPTWPVGRPRPPITIDHVLASREFEPVRVTVLALPRSDHRAVFAELRVRR